MPQEVRILPHYALRLVTVTVSYDSSPGDMIGIIGTTIITQIQKKEKASEAISSRGLQLYTALLFRIIIPRLRIRHRPV